MSSVIPEELEKTEGKACHGQTMRTNDDEMEGRGVKGQRGRGKKCKKLRN